MKKKPITIIAGIVLVLVAGFVLQSRAGTGDNTSF